MYPFVSLQDFSLNEQLARRLPRQLAYYHLALPIGTDDEGITVAMAQPDNVKAHEIIQKALAQSIIIVKSTDEQIRRCLDTVWEVSHHPPWSQITISQHDDVVDYYAKQLAEIYTIPIVPYHDGITENSLLICHFSELPSWNLSSSVLLVNRIADPIIQILHLVRLHTPDESVFAHLLPLIQKNNIQATLLPDTASVSHNLAYLLDSTSPQGQHLERLKRQLDGAGVRGILRLRQYSLTEALPIELKAQSYDLVAVAADAYGEMVQTLIEVVKPYNIPAMMIIKPDLQNFGA